MTMSDPLGDMLTRIRNGQSARKSVVSSPSSRFRTNVLEVLKREGYIRNYSSVDVRPGIKELKIELKYHDGQPVISEIRSSSSAEIERFPSTILLMVDRSTFFCTTASSRSASAD